MIKFIWMTFCTIAGIAIGAGLFWGIVNSAAMAALGAIVGAVLGWLFGKFIPLSDFLMGIDP